MKETMNQIDVEQLQESQMLRMLAFGGFHQPVGNTAAAPVAFFIHLTNKAAEARRAMTHRNSMIQLTRTPTLVERLHKLGMRYLRYRQLKETLGENAEVPFQCVDELIKEVERHRWLEAEKAGRDIWAHLNPYDPQGCAARDWYEKHYRGWRQKSVCQQASA